MEAMQSVQITIKGKVQNVGFRYHTQAIAKELGIKGYVKNLSNGAVYIEAEGKSKILKQFIIWCQSGPDWARVIHVNINHQKVCNYKSFTIKR